MGKLKLTSPGVLLIVAVVLASAIFLTDQFYLLPCVTSQKTAALREEAIRSQRLIRLAIEGQQDALLRTCSAWAQNPRLSGTADPASGAGERLDPAAGRAFSSSGVDAAWFSDKAGQASRIWSGASVASRPSRAGVEEVVRVVRALGNPLQAPESGLITVSSHVALFARQPISGTASAAPVSGYLWLVRFLDGDLMEKAGSAAGGALVLVAGQAVPKSQVDDDCGGCSLWTRNDDCMVVAWQATDCLGNRLGYFQADVPIVQIQRQASSARRTVLIVLSLSVGLVLIVILGTHMLIAGPVIRLVTRLQQMESGSSAAKKDLTRDLHGEPLVLARRLESAFDKLAHMSRTDQLTALANRGNFEEVLRCFYHQARRYNRPLAVMMIDIDYFKAANDTGGHHAGDEVLRQVASIIESMCRKADLPARLGGDEFGVLLPETAAAEAFGVAERIRVAVSRIAIPAKGATINVTASIGIADLNAGEIDSPDGMTSLADRALYAAKDEGRNRVIQAHDLQGVSLTVNSDQSGKVDVLCRKLAGLDTKFKDLFVEAFEEVMGILEGRSPHMADHARKVQHYAELIGREMELPERVIKRLQIGAMLHDIGMAAMPDSVLLNPGPLGEDDLQMMRRHPLLSVRIMERMEFLEQEIPAVRYHHERYDGTGYPEGIAGAAIPLTARILAVADAFEAMTSSRPFRRAKTLAEAVEEVRHGSGTQFDPAVVEAFLGVAVRLGDKMLEVPGIASASSAELFAAR